MVAIAKFSPAIIAAIIIAACSASYIQKSPAKVLISQDRSNKDTLKVDIKGNGKVHQLRMSPAKNVLAKGAKIVELKSKRGTAYLEELNLSNDFKIYKDSKAGAVLAVKDGRVSGVVGHNNLAVKFEDGQQVLYESSNERSNGDDYLEIPDELNERESPMAYRNDYLEIPDEELNAREMPNNFESFRNDYLEIPDDDLNAKESPNNFESYRNDYLEVPDDFLNAREISNKSYHNDYLEIPANAILKGRATENAISRQTGSFCVEIAVVVDSTLASEFPTNQEIYEYVAIFINAVNERYDTITTPQIEIKLVAVVIIRSTTEEPFITSNQINANQIKGGETLTSFSTWVKTNENTLPPADIYYLQTGKNMVDISNPTAGVNLAGIAWRAAACAASPTINYSSGMGEDMGGFYNGVHTATHEIAHILGAPHDGQADLNTGSCSWTGGHIMSYTAGTINRLTFSSCSIERMNTYMSTAACLSCSSTVVQSPCIPDTNQLPGDVLSMDDQCKGLSGYDNATVYTGYADENMLCYQMACQVVFANGTVRAWAYGSTAAENSPCPSGGKCVDGACV